MVPVVKSAMRVIVGLESDEQNEYAFQAFLRELWEFAERLGIKKLARHYTREDFEEDLIYSNG